MKKHICFAGFIAEELSALQTATATLSNLWDCSFVPDADSVLSKLADQPHDAIIAYMAMPGNTGAELLQIVQQFERGQAHSLRRCS